MVMPYPRKTPLVNSEFYHIFNKGIDGRITFEDERDFERAYQIISYYRFSSPPIRLSIYLDQTEASRIEIQKRPWGEKLITIVCYCLMPNHFHFLLRQEIDGGISRFISQFLNSYTRYFNTRNIRIGQLFLDRFQNVLVTSESQMLHLSRYIHLNPFSSQVVRSYADLRNYKWSSFPEYINDKEEGICKKDVILSSFESVAKYEEFVSNRKDYQREIKRIENLILE
ncbi:MAG: hypothetical protein UU03_C0001G0005 [Candidatus Woesebacteria bacterium GW2011_GWA1_40_45]|uniref:Transposase IS200-like domain-containing protein n=5 Tax=Candidatus Woeseibacteriota TaxID=1752722 RepID=A0A0G0UVL8_9BACT|nr:MAG: hypothetical protein UT72_C0001G0005 [Candidatus Woesebacteria bacterium GW2011_GWB1_40_101]KKR63655.1 MAG: hypothetical protein UU03_C0001G0005 [Candidatus Woesebacteria bacterium GW2011_GWA1_40_45]